MYFSFKYQWYDIIDITGSFLSFLIRCQLSFGKFIWVAILSLWGNRRHTLLCIHQSSLVLKVVLFNQTSYKHNHRMFSSTLNMHIWSIPFKLEMHILSWHNIISIARYSPTGIISYGNCSTVTVLHTPCSRLSPYWLYKNYYVVEWSICASMRLELFTATS